jgi:hypothetical protein
MVNMCYHSAPCDLHCEIICEVAGNSQTRWKTSGRVDELSELIQGDIG